MARRCAIRAGSAWREGPAIRHDAGVMTGVFGDVRSRLASQQPAIPRVKRRCLLTGGRFHAARITLSER